MTVAPGLMGVEGGCSKAQGMSLLLEFLGERALLTPRSQKGSSYSFISPLLHSIP